MWCCCVAGCVCCCLQLGKYDLAIQDYTKALDVDPANSFAYYNRGITKDRMGDFEGAVADFSSAISLDPANADFYHNRGFSLRKQVRSAAGVRAWFVAALPPWDMGTWQDCGDGSVPVNASMDSNFSGWAQPLRLPAWPQVLAASGLALTLCRFLRVMRSGPL